MTYADSLSTSRDKVRFLLGDTSGVSATEMLSDNEIAWVLSEESSNVYRAAASGADAIAAKFARLADTTVGDTSVSASQKQAQYAELAERLRRKASSRGSAAPFMGGISISERDAAIDDTDKVSPFFSRQNPGETVTVDRVTEFGR